MAAFTVRSWEFLVLLKWSRFSHFNHVFDSLLKLNTFWKVNSFVLHKQFLTWAIGSCPWSCAPPPVSHSDPLWRRRCPGRVEDSAVCACASWKLLPGLTPPPRQTQFLSAMNIWRERMSYIEIRITFGHSCWFNVIQRNHAFQICDRYIW